MQIFDYRSSSADSLPSFSPSPPQKSVLSLGGFDGIHLGHQSLIQCVKEVAFQENAPAGICLLDPLPFQVLGKGSRIESRAEDGNNRERVDRGDRDRDSRTIHSRAGGSGTSFGRNKGNKSSGKGGDKKTKNGDSRDEDSRDSRDEDSRDRGSDGDSRDRDDRNGDDRNGGRKARAFNRLFTVEETQEILKPLGLDFLCILPFSFQFSRLSPEEFVHSFLLKTFNPLRLVVGYDFNFAHKKQGDFSLLQKLASEKGISVQRVSAVELEDQPVSSSRIRKYLSLGEMEQVKSLLGRAFSIKGKVKKGNALGRKLGFPTANLHVEGKLLPRAGVYSGTADWGKTQHKAAINIGQRPTLFAENVSSSSPPLNSSSFLSIEAHLLRADSTMNLYGESLQLNLESFVRQEQAFSNLQGLRSAIEQDIQKILKLSH